MFTLRATRKAMKRYRFTPEPFPPPTTTKLGDWYVNLLNLGRERLVLCVSERTLLPVIVRAAGPDLAARLRDGLRATLEALGAESGAIETELEAMAEVAVAKAGNFSVLGSMQDFALEAPYFREAHPKASLLAMGLSLADTPCGPMGYQSPDRATLELLGEVPRAPRPRPVLRLVRTT